MSTKSKKNIKTYKFDLIGNSLTTFDEFPYRFLLPCFKTTANSDSALIVSRKYSEFPVHCSDRVVSEFPKGALPILMLLAKHRGFRIGITASDQPYGQQLGGVCTISNNKQDRDLASFISHNDLGLIECRDRTDQLSAILAVLKIFPETNVIAITPYLDERKRIANCLRTYSNSIKDRIKVGTYDEILDGVCGCPIVFHMAPTWVYHPNKELCFFGAKTSRHYGLLNLADRFTISDRAKLFYFFGPHELVYDPRSTVRPTITVEWCDYVPTAHAPRSYRHCIANADLDWEKSVACHVRQLLSQQGLNTTYDTGGRYAQLAPRTIVLVGEYPQALRLHRQLPELPVVADTMWLSESASNINHDLQRPSRTDCVVATEMGISRGFLKLNRLETIVRVDRGLGGLPRALVDQLAQLAENKTIKIKDFSVDRNGYLGKATRSRRAAYREEGYHTEGQPTPGTKIKLFLENCQVEVL